MTQKELDNIPIGSICKAVIGYKPERTKFKIFNSQGIQSDDIGGEYIKVPEQKGIEIVGIVVEDRHPNKIRKGKLFKLLQWKDNNGDIHQKLLKTLSNIQIIKL